MSRYKIDMEKLQAHERVQLTELDESVTRAIVRMVEQKRREEEEARRKKAKKKNKRP